MLEIIYQDDWLVAVNKPSGWLVHRSWLDRDEKVVVMQTVRISAGSCTDDREEGIWNGEADEYSGSWNC